MTESRTLQAEDQVAHYRIVGPLGAGGMGEVYLAQDGKLERSVALKVLPPDLVRNEDRVRRFVQEAKSASSLNHPNIVTIYEIGEEPVTSGSGETSPAPVRYISMELVKGRTLSTKIHEENVDLRTLLGYLAQAAEGIAKAHAAGIVHRDLKPGNIMVSDDGFAKVLDFGLAKLTEKHGPEPSATALTQKVEETAEGTVMGTVHYMSPEQVQGRPVDHRSDVFSFGCILYEAATRNRPFGGDSSVEIMHAILHDTPPPIEEVNPAVPTELRRLIRRCLRKAPDRRVQSMRDLALELHEIVDEYDELSASAISAGSGSAPAVAAVSGRRLPLFPVLGIGVVVVAAAVFFALHGRNAPGAADHAYQTARFTTVTQSGQVADAALSRDGRYVAYLAPEPGGMAMTVRQVATGSDVQVIAPTTRPIGRPAFSPDGNYLFYSDIKPETPRYRTLYRIPSLGGSPEEVAFDVDSRVVFSPDGSRMAFARFDSQGAGSIQVMPASGGEPRQLIRFDPPENLDVDLSWSPDGRWIAAPVFTPPPATEGAVVLVDSETGKRTDGFSRKPAYIQGVAWSGEKSDDGFFITAMDLRRGPQPQVFRVSYPGGALQRITNDANSYTHPSVSAEGALSVVRESYRPDLISIGPRGGDPETILRTTSSDNAPFHFEACGDRIVYTRPQGGGDQVYAQALGGGPPVPIPSHGGFIPTLACGGESVFLAELDAESGEVSLWRAGLNGSGLHRLPLSAPAVADVSADGKYLAYVPVDKPKTLWILPTDGGAPRQLVEGFVGRQGVSAFSPDGSRLLVECNDTSGDLVKSVYEVVQTAGDPSPERLPLPDKAAAIAWVPGEEAVVYRDDTDPFRNLWRFPLDGGKPARLTSVTTGRVQGLRFAPDGRMFAVVVRGDAGDAIRVIDREGREADRETSVAPRQVYWFDWAGNPPRVVAAVGEPTRDVVMVRNLR